MNRVAWWLAVLVLSAALLMGGLSKLQAPEPAVAGLLLVFPGLGDVVGASIRLMQALGVFELTLAALLLTTRWSGNWTLCVLFLLLGFAAWDVFRWANGQQPTCGCFGTWIEFHRWNHVLAKHLVLFTCAIVYAVGHGAKVSVSEVPTVSW